MRRITYNVKRKTYQFLPQRKSGILRFSCYMLRDKNGFTLMEAIVATAVFAFVVSSVLGVYLSVIQLDAKTRSQRAVTQNARFVTEYIAKEIRNSTIDYAAYAGGTAANTDTEIFFMNQANEATHIYLNGENLVLQKPQGTTNLNADNVRITKFKILVSPTTDPFTTVQPPPVNLQPSATLILELVSTFGRKPTDSAKLNIQSTFTSRDYPSR